MHNVAIMKICLSTVFYLIFQVSWTQIQPHVNIWPIGQSFPAANFHPLTLIDWDAQVNKDRQAPWQKESQDIISSHCNVQK